MKRNNFDFIAPGYDILARLVFGNRIRNAQTYFLNRIRSDSTVLVMGSGTGWIANEILNTCPQAKITLVDTSRRMTERAQKRLKDKAIKIHCTDENQSFDEPFDVIMLPFFLDLFPDEKLKLVLENIQCNAHEKTLWLIADFVDDQWWHEVYLAVMYRFFKITASIESHSLPAWRFLLTETLELKDETRFYGKFISAGLYQSRN